MKKHYSVPVVDINLHQHNMDQFLRCPYKYYMANVMGYRLMGIKKALNIGDLFAQCVFFLHRGEDIAKCMLYVEELQKPLIERATNQAQVDELETSAIMVQSMLMGYETMFLNKKEIKVTKYNQNGGIDGFDEITIQEIVPEYKLEIPWKVGNYHYKYINRLDGKVITDDTGLWILELKTSTSIDGDLILKLNTNFQINSYWFSMLYNEQQEVDGVLYRYIRKPSIRQNKNEALEKFRIRLSKDYQERPDFYFYEESLYFNQPQIKIFTRDMNYHFEELTRCYVTNVWPKRGVACDSNFGLCEYLKYCSNPTQETLDTYYRKTLDE